MLAAASHAAAGLCLTRFGPRQPPQKTETTDMDWDRLSDRLGQFGESVGGTLKGIFGARNERMVKRLVPLVAEINSLEPWAKGLTAEQFHEQTRLFKEQFKKGEKTLEDLIPRA